MQRTRVRGRTLHQAFDPVAIDGSADTQLGAQTPGHGLKLRARTMDQRPLG